MKLDPQRDCIGKAESLPSRGAWIEIGTSKYNRGKRQSLPSRGAWIEICICSGEGGSMRSLPSRGAWIEIFLTRRIGSTPSTSLPSRGAWIEIEDYVLGQAGNASRSPHGERGLKFSCFRVFHRIFCRSPHGERGLKWRRCRPWTLGFWSLPSRGAWIEIFVGQVIFMQEWSLPSRGAWIEISHVLRHYDVTGRSPHGERGLKFL